MVDDALWYNTDVILKHRDRELLHFDWIGDVRVRVDGVNDAERRFLPLEFGEDRFGDLDALRYELTEDLMERVSKLEKFHFKKHRHYNWTNERLKVLTGFLQKRASDICKFGKEVDRKDEQSIVLESAISSENVGVKSSGESALNRSEQQATQLILRNSSVTEEEIANQLDVTIRQAERIIAALKKKAGLRRRGTDKVGEWYFDT